MGYEFISCDTQLPPTECPLVIELPLGTRIYGVKNWEVGEEITKAKEVMIAPAHRVNHIETKERDMRFELADGMWVIGRFGWTYP